MKKWPKCLWFPFCYTAFSQLAPLASADHREYPWFTDRSTQHAGITQKWTVAAIQPLSGISLKDSGEEKFPHWAELQYVHLVHFACKDKWSKLVTRESGKEASLYGKIYPTWMFTKGWHQQIRILKIKWIGWLALQIPSPRLTASFLSHSSPHPMGSWTNYVWWQRWRPHYLWSTLPAVENNNEFLIRNYSLGLSASYLAAGWLQLGCLHHGRGSILFKLKQALLIYFCLSCMQYFYQNYHLWT